MGVFEKAVVCGDGIVDYIPQRPPIVMVDAFYGVEGADSLSGLTISEDTAFCLDGVLDECGLIEHIAQSAALRVGYVATAEGRTIPSGMIGSVDRFTLHAAPRVGDRIQTRVTFLQEVGDVSLLSAETTAGATLVCECRMKVVLRNE